MSSISLSAKTESAKAEPAVRETAFEPAALQALLAELSPQQVLSLARSYQEAVEEIFHRLDKAAQDANFDAIRFEAHDLIDAAGHFGALHLNVLAIELAEACEIEAAAETIMLMKAMRCSAESAWNAIQAYLAPLEAIGTF